MILMIVIICKSKVTDSIELDPSSVDPKVPNIFDRIESGKLKYF